MRCLVGTACGLLLLATAASAAEVKVLDGDAAFPEGPAVIDGELFYTEYAGNTVDRWDGTAKSVLWKEEGCGPSAVLALGADLVVTCYDSGTIARITRDGKTVAAYARDADGNPLQGPNDFTSDGRGDGRQGVYFTASGPWEPGPIVGKVFHLAADGTVRAVADDLHYANGIVLGGDGRLYVNESEAGRVISFKVAPDGTLTDRRLFVRLFAVDPASGPEAYPDGLKLGPDGNFYIGQYSSGRIVVVDPKGALVRVITVPSPAAPNLAFSPDGGLLYVTAVDDKAAAPYRGKLYAVPLNEAAAQ